MLIAFIVIVSLFLIFTIVTFFMTRKNITLKVGERNFRITCVGSKLNIYVNDTLVASDQMPQLIYGEEYNVKHGEEEFCVKCKSSTYGSVLRVEIYQNGKLLLDNGKVLKEKKKADK